LQDWAKIGGGGLIWKYKTTSKLLKAVYPDYKWLPWKFSSKNAWKNENNIREFFDYAGKQLGVNSFDDWYKVSRKVCCVCYYSQNVKDLAELGYKYNEDLAHALSIAYPEHKWTFNLNKSKSVSQKKSQQLLKTILKSIFPKEGKNRLFVSDAWIVEVLEEYHHPDIKNSGNFSFELDLFFPYLNIAFEYQVFLFWEAG
jgi:hypothetical protein